MEKIQYAPDYGPVGHTALQIPLGGTNGRTPEEALIELGLASGAKLGVPGGMAKSTIENLVDFANIRPEEAYLPTLKGPKFVMPNSSGEYEITNYDALTKYTVSATVGNVTVSGNKVYYNAPGDASLGGFNINGVEIVVGIGDSTPKVPIIIAPVSGSEQPSFPVNVVSSVFAMQTPLASDTHQMSDWEVSENGIFTNIVRSSYNDTTNKTSFTVDGLTIGKIYYVRVRHKGAVTGWSGWSKTNAIMTKTSYPIRQSWQFVAPKPDPSWFTISESENGTCFGTTGYLYGELGYVNSSGHAVALNAGGDICIIGACMEGRTRAGGAYAFRKVGEEWVSMGKLEPDYYEGESRYGYSVAIAPDGSVCAVGAKYKDDEAKTYGLFGAFYLFKNTGTAWELSQKIYPHSTTGSSFGWTLTFSNDGSTLAVGWPGYSLQQEAEGGIAIYEKENGKYEYKVVLYDNLAAGAYLGMVKPAFNSNGTICAVGNPNTEGGYGSVLMFVKDDFGNWSIRQRIKDLPVVGWWNHFGHSVDISADGNTLVIGASHYDQFGSDSGSAIIYKKVGSVWEKETVLNVSGAKASDYIGLSGVQISSNGKVCLISSPRAKNGIFNESGAAYIFIKGDDGTWTQVNRLEPNPIMEGQRFGSDLALSKDGSTCAVGFRGGQHEQSGFVNIYNNLTKKTLAVNGPSAISTIVDSPTEIADRSKDRAWHFGHYVTMSGDGKTAAVCALYATTNDVALHHGSVYIFTNSGGAWTQQTRLVTPILRGSSLFGYCAALSHDGNYCVASSFNDNSNRGAVYTFVRTGTTWAYEATINPPSRGTEDIYRLGSSLALSSDASLMFVGARETTVNYKDGVSGSWGGVGATYIYERVNGVWSLKQPLFPPSEVFDQGPLFGTSVACTPDGAIVVVGADGTDWATGNNSHYSYSSGSAFVYERKQGYWTFVQRIMPSRPEWVGGLGTLAISDNGNTIAVGSPRHPGANNSDGGAVYLYQRLSDGLWKQMFEVTGYRNDPGLDTRYLGMSVSLSGDGTILFAGAMYASDISVKDTGYEEGAVHVYVHDDYEWNLRKIIYNPVTNNQNNYTEFGRTVAMSKDGKYAVTGQRYWDDIAKWGDDNLGRAYFFA